MAAHPKWRARGLLVAVALAAACGGASDIEPDRRTAGGATDSSGGAASGPSIGNGGAASGPSIGNGGAASGPGIGGGGASSGPAVGSGGAASGPVITSGPSGGSSGGGASGCGADSDLCSALEAAFKGGGDDAFNCADTTFPSDVVAKYVTVDTTDPNLEQCALRDGDVIGALASCWAFHCAEDASDCPSFSGSVTQNACAAIQLCGSGGSVGNVICSTQNQVPCSTLMGFSSEACGSN